MLDSFVTAALLTTAQSFSEDLVDSAAGEAGVISLLVYFVVAIQKGWWVSGHQHKDVAKERDEWKLLALESMKTTSVAIEQVETKDVRRRQS